MPTTPTDSDSAAATVCDSMILPSRGAAVCLLGLPGCEITGVQSMIVNYKQSCFVQRMVLLFMLVALKLVQEK